MKFCKLFDLCSTSDLPSREEIIAIFATFAQINNLSSKTSI